MSAVKHQPATALPWTVGPDMRGKERIFSPASDYEVARAMSRGARNARDRRTNRNYLAHAANAYPKLVDAIRRLIDIPEVAKIAKGTDAMRVARELLRELGEES